MPPVAARRKQLQGRLVATRHQAALRTSKCNVALDNTVSSAGLQMEPVGKDTEPNVVLPGPLESPDAASFEQRGGAAQLFPSQTSHIRKEAVASSNRRKTEQKKATASAREKSREREREQETLLCISKLLHSNRHGIHRLHRLQG